MKEAKEAKEASLSSLPPILSKTHQLMDAYWLMARKSERDRLMERSNMCCHLVAKCVEAQQDGKMVGGKMRQLLQDGNMCLEASCSRRLHPSSSNTRLPLPSPLPQTPVAALLGGLFRTRP